MIENLAGILIVLGAAVISVSAIGILRMKNVFFRIHVVTKSPSFGFLLMLSGFLLKYFSAIHLAKSLLLLFFVFFTVPLASHMIIQVAYQMNRRNADPEMRDDIKNPPSEG